jgi:hypothetical protein
MSRKIQPIVSGEVVLQVFDWLFKDGEPAEHFIADDFADHSPLNSIKASRVFGVPERVQRYRWRSADATDKVIDSAGHLAAF